ncbi:transmembrane protein 247 [Ctenodactylus gundi]
MATEEMMESRGAGESCPSKSVPADAMPEVKPRAVSEPEALKPDSACGRPEERETGEDRDCPGPPKPPSPKAGPGTKGQAGDAPEPVEPPPGRGAEPGTSMELEKVRMEFELTRLKYVHEENERQRQHEEVMEQLQQQAVPRQFPGGLQDLLLPQNQFAMFLYCFIFVHLVYVTKETVFFLFSRHYLFCIAAILLCLIKTLWPYAQDPATGEGAQSSCQEEEPPESRSGASWQVAGEPPSEVTQDARLLQGPQDTTPSAQVLKMAPKPADAAPTPAVPGASALAWTLTRWNPAAKTVSLAGLNREDHHA